MIDIFKHAPDGAVELRHLNSGPLRWFNSNGERYVNKKWLKNDNSGWEVIATRPTEPATQKTVEDAWEAFGCRWVDEQEALYDDIEKGCLVWGTRVNWDSDELVCTREQFEAYGREQQAPEFKATRENLEKIAESAEGHFVDVSEGEKWTHEYLWSHAWHKCILLNEGKKDCDGYYAAINEGDGYVLSTNVRPIKPTITKADVKAVEDYVNWLASEKSITIGRDELLGCYLDAREVK